MYLQRHLDDALAAWYGRDDRKPLVLRGARQTGKSTSVREFGKCAQLFIELNLERREDLALVRASSSVADLLAGIQVRHGLARIPDEALLFLDEIQESPKLIEWLRFFREDHPRLAVIAAGSLLEVRLQERGFSFPVGRVTFRTLHPLSFAEFLRGTGNGVLAEQLWGDLRALRASPQPVHEEALQRLRDYLLVGGMPEAVAMWAARRDPAAVRQVHGDLLQAFSEDFQKYRRVRDLSPLEAAFENLKHHVGKRFSYENFAPGRSSQQMKTALGRLEQALLIARVWPTSDRSLPLRPRPKSAPKLLFVDAGLSWMTLGMPIEQLHRLSIAQMLNGRLSEMFVGQQLRARRPEGLEPLYFWVSPSSRGSAEVDYLLPLEGAAVPVEVKSTASGWLKSLHRYLLEAPHRTGVRLQPATLSDQRLTVKMPEGRLRYRLLSVPIYMAEWLWDWLGEA